MSLCQAPLGSALITRSVRSVPAGPCQLHLRRGGVPRGSRVLQPVAVSAAPGSAAPGSAAPGPAAPGPAAPGPAAPGPATPRVEASVGANGSSSFLWGKHWYGVAAARDIDPSRPNAITLLGKRLVVWKDKSGAWSCLEDRCPHRAAPLSEGKVWRDGTLSCSYHGWRFAGSGACQAIPQAASAAAEARAAASARACAVPHPIQERQGMVFVWGEGGLAAFEESVQHEPPICPLTEEAELRGARLLEIQPRYTRDLPYDYAALVENLVDPAHVPWAHHGVLGSRDSVEFGQMQLRKSGKLAVQYGGSGPMISDTAISFHPPGLVKYMMSTKKGGRASMVFWVTPTTPGRCRVTQYTTTDQQLPLLDMLPAWLPHLSASAIFDGDNVFLAGQDSILVKSAQGGESWRNLFYMPTAADSLVAAARDWLDTVGGGGPFGSLKDSTSPATVAAAAALLAPANEGRRGMLDRYHQHTVTCKPCREALSGITLLRNLAAAAAAVAWAACLMPFLGQILGLGPLAGSTLSATASVVAVPFVLAAAFTGAGLLLHNLRSKFIFVDYVHAHK